MGSSTEMTLRGLASSIPLPFKYTITAVVSPILGNDLCMDSILLLQVHSDRCPSHTPHMPRECNHMTISSVIGERSVKEAGVRNCVLYRADLGLGSGIGPGTVLRPFYTLTQFEQQGEWSE